MIAFFLDAGASGLVASLWTAPQPAGAWSFIPLTLLYVGAIRLTGQTMGMALLKVRLVRVGSTDVVSLPRAVVRFVLLCALIPALISDRDGRGLHDKVAGTAVVRT